jgi:DNA-binding response OmpR family regulator
MRPVLVVDDSTLVRRALVKGLAAAGLEVREADSVATGSRVDATEIACAVLDLELGDGDGVAIADALRAKDDTLPIAFFSAGADAAIVDRARALGPVFAKSDGPTDVVRWATDARSVAR